MEEPAHVDVLTDRRFQERFWVVVRIGWVVMLAILVAAVLGFTGGGGAFSDRTLELPTGEIQMPSISRWAAADTMTIKLADPGVRTARILLPHTFGDSFAIESISPQPAKVVSGPEGDIYEFDIAPGASRTIDFSLRAAKPSWQGSIGAFEVNGARSGPSSVLILP